MIRGVARGTRVKFNISTIIVIGSTDVKTSFSFCVNIFIFTSLPFLRLIKNLLFFIVRNKIPQISLNQSINFNKS
jgi:hypothetical protein